MNAIAISMRFGCGRVLAGLVACAVLAAAVPPACGQDRRRKLTELMKETQLRIQKAVTDDEKQAAADLLESCRHELGIRDADGKKLTWDVSYHGALVTALDAKITEMEGLAKGAWGLLPLADDTQRAWRILARQLLRQADVHGDANERRRYGFAGMLLVHNADILDRLLADLPKIEAARKATPNDDQHRPRRNTLGGGLNAAGRIVTLCRRVLDGKTKMGHGELADLSNQLRRISRASQLLAEPVAAAAGASPPAATGATEDPRLKQADELEPRIKALTAAQGDVARKLAGYLDQVRIGLAHESARPLAVKLLDHVQRAVALLESISTSDVASEAYRNQVLSRLADAVNRIAAKSTRDDGYRKIRDVERDDQQRARFDALPVAKAVKASLWQGYEWAEAAEKRPGQSPEKDLGGKLRHVLGLLAWRVERLHGEPQPADRYLAAQYRRGLKVLGDNLGQAAQPARDHLPETEGAAWEAIGTIDRLDVVRRTDAAIADARRTVSVSEPIRRACGMVASWLFDGDGGNNGRARSRLNNFRNALADLRRLHQMMLPREDRPEAARLSRGKYYSTFRAATDRALPLLKTLLEGNREEYDYLRSVLPLYRMMAEWMVLRRAQTSGDLDRCCAASSFTVDPARVYDLGRKASERLGRIFIEMAKTRREDVGPLIDPARNHEHLCRSAVAALLESMRDPNAPSRLEAVFDNLRRTSRDDPGWDIRQRWHAAWDVNQALEAYGRGYVRTGDYHARRTHGNNPLLNVPLSIDGGRN